MDSEEFPCYDLDNYEYKEENTVLPSGMKSVMELQDLLSLPDNGRVIPDLAKGVLQPLEDNSSVDELFQDVNFELLSQMFTQDDFPE